jgi:RNA recognition motif-containing protein
MSARLFVGNLSVDTDNDELGALFSEVGFVESCLVITDPESGRSKGYAFIKMGTREAAEAAREKFNGHDLRGRPLIVNELRSGGVKRNPAGYSSVGRS